MSKIRTFLEICYNKGISKAIEEVFSHFERKLREYPQAHLYAKLVGPIVEYHGVRLDISNVSPHIGVDIHRGWHEEDEIKAISGYLDDGYDVLELGGFVGFVSCFISSNYETNEHIVLEPNKSIIDTLDRNKALNKCTFQIENVAYSERDSETLSIPSNEREASLYGDSGEQTQVKTANVEQMINKYGLSRIALVVDIEGGEAELIENELGLLEDSCALLVVEFHECQFDDGIKERIRNAKSSLSSSSFNKVDEFGDVQVYSNPELQP